jgi:uncharacterized surface protein with fasciclin (FAS1) repeats
MLLDNDRAKDGATTMHNPILVLAGAMTVVGLSISSVAAGHGYAQTATTGAAASSLQEVIENEPRFSIFANALKQTGLWQDLESREASTVFVPSDEALKAAGSAPLLEGVLLSEANRKRLRDVMSYHVHVGQQLSPAGIENVELVAENGACLLISRVGGGIRVGPSAVVTQHIRTNDGSLFVIDRLLWRPWNGEDLCR